MKVTQKWSWPIPSCSIRPVIRGYQWYMAPKTTRIGATPITMWKCATTNMVSDNGTSTTTLPRNKPVMPPLTKVTMKASAKSIGSVNWMLPFHSVSVQL